MVVENGYKNTEIGIIPEDWNINTLKNVCLYRRGSFPQPYGLAKWYDEINGAPFVQVFDIDHNWKIKPQTKRYISKVAQELSIFAPKESILLTIQGSIGRIAITQYDAYVDRTLLIFESFKIAFDKKYFCLAIETLFEREKKNAPGGIIKTITKEALSVFEIPIPPLPEQTAIATALSDMDELIAQTEKLIEKKKAIKQGVMQELLRPKEGWVTKKLGDIFKISSSSSKSNYIVDSGKFVIMDMGSVSSNGAIIKTKKTDNNCDLLSFGDLVMPKDDIGGGYIIGKVGFIDKNDYYVLGDHVYKLLAIDSTIDTHFFYYLINSFYVNKHLRSKASGSAQLGLGRKAVLEQELIFPDSRIKQISISETLADMDKEILVLELQNHKLKLQKQGMMQALLTGKIRLV
jgi:type I restriction enzyme S subunit